MTTFLPAAILLPFIGEFSMQNYFQELIENLSKELEAPLTSSQNHTEYVLEAGAFLLMFHYLSEAKQMLIATCVAELPVNGKEKLYFSLLNGQYFFKETAGATLAVDNDEKFITLQLVQPLSIIEPENFSLIVEHFLQAALLWRSRCADMQKAADSSEENIFPPHGYDTNMIRI